MYETSKRLLQIPQGTEGYYLEEAYRHRQLTRRLEDLFDLWGYLPVQTPVFDFFDTYRPLLDAATQEKTYRLIDRDGDLLMLRSDVTLFLAKQMGMILSREDLPVRVSYGDTILRHQEAEDIGSNEFFQSGAELIGVPGPDGDLEAITLLLAALERLEVPAARVFIGSRSLFAAVADGVPACPREAFLQAVRNRDAEGVASLLQSADVPRERVAFLRRLFLTIGAGPECAEIAAEGRRDGVLSVEAAEAVRYLADLAAVLDELGAADRVRIDLSEVGSQPYHSGVVFQAYVPGEASEVASGGRYDGLLRSFGFDAPSVGFSLMLRKLEHRVADTAHVAPPPPAWKRTDQGFVEAFRTAQRVRNDGRPAVL